MEKTFLQTFANANPHMIVIENPDGSVTMEPPNQLDWTFKLKPVSKFEWFVEGAKAEDGETYEATYKFSDGAWKISSR